MRGLDTLECHRVRNMKTYRELLVIPGVLRLLFSATFPRLAYAMVSLAIFFRVEDATGSVSVAGLAIGALSLTTSLTAGPRGHAIDKWGQTRPLIALMPLYVLTNLALALFAHTATSAVGLALLVGASAPPVNMGIRPLWSDIVGPERVRSAYGLDSSHQNAIGLLGPVIATALAVRFGGHIAVLVVAGSMLIGGILLATNPHSRSWVPEARVPDAPGLLRTAAIRLMALEGVAMGLAMGFVTIGIPAMATLSGNKSAAGPLMAAIGLGSIIGTVWAGARAKDIAPVIGLRTSMGLFSLILLPLAWVPLGPWLFVLLVVAFTVAGPAQVFYLETIDAVRPRGTQVAALGSLWMIEGAAGALASALGANLAESVSPQLTLALGSAFCILSPIILTFGIRNVLQPATTPPPKSAETSLDAAETLLAEADESPAR